MTSRSDFNGEEWEQVSSLPVLVTAGAAFADGRKLVTTVREVVAGQKALADGIAAHPDSELLQALGTDAPSVNLAEGATSSNVAEVSNAMADKVAAGFAILKAKATPEEVQQVGELLMAVATAAAERTGSGALGFGGDAVDANEQAFLDKLSAIIAS